MEAVMTSSSCCLTTKDFAVLEVMLERRRAFVDPMARMLEDKLSNAALVSIDSVEPDIVTLNSRVVFRIDAGPSETRTLVQNEGRGPVGSSLSVAMRRGLCMLGMSEGQAAMIEQADGRRESILIKAVLYQPEAARRAVRQKSASGGRRPPALTLV
jgi:regulator of nucleoside diphosphate kinase